MALVLGDGGRRCSTVASRDQARGTTGCGCDMEGPKKRSVAANLGLARLLELISRTTGTVRSADRVGGPVDSRLE